MHNQFMNKFSQTLLIAFLLVIFACLLGGSLRSTYAQGASRPILVVYNDSAPNKFGRYLGEILRAEGLNSYDLESLGSVSASQLASYRVVVLGETPLNVTEASLFTNYVNGGGHLIAMRPDSDIKSLFQLDTNSGQLTDGYMKMPGSGPSQGLSTATLQIHGDTDRWTLSGATTLAQLYSSATTQTTFPAVVRSANGRGTAFLYDLARNVVFTRQGNPANADVDVDADGTFRTTDLFDGAGGSDPWVNLDNVPIPQADMQQRLFAHLVRDAIDNAFPMPQLWYFPGTAKTMLISTGDAHANPAGWYQDLIDTMNAENGDITIYVSIGQLDDTLVQVWRSQGHELGIHPPWFHLDTYEPFNIESLPEGYEVYDSWFPMAFSSPKSRTVRNHQVAWLGWTDAAELAVSHGLAMDTNFYAWDDWLKKSDDTWAHGYVNGSGQPMKFAKADGTILPYYQQVTSLIDEQLLNGAGAGSQYEDLSIANATLVSQGLIDASLAGNYAAIMTQFHVDYFNEAEEWVANTLSYAASNSVPLWNADKWLTFTETRYGANYANFDWNTTTNRLTFNLTATAQPGLTLSTMMPLNYDGNTLDSVTVDGINHVFTSQQINGQSVAFITVPAGNHTIVADYLGDPAPPTPNVPNAAPSPYWKRSLDVSLSWTAITWAEFYEIQISENTSFMPPLPIDGVVNASTLSVVISVPQEGTYYWRIRAKDPVVGWKAWSAPQRFTVDTP
jgi:hypothetical protein